MNHDQLFRLILLAWFVIFMPIGVYHRLRSLTGERLDRRQEGIFILITLRLIGVGGIIGLIAYLISPANMAWASVPLPVWLRWTGVGLSVIAGLLLVWMFHTLGRNLTDTVVTRKEHTLCHHRPVPLGPASLLHLRWGVGPRLLAHRSQLVFLCRRLPGVPVARHPDPEGRGKPHRQIR